MYKISLILIYAAVLILNGCAAFPGDESRLDLSQFKSDSQLHSVSLARNKDRYEITTQSFLNCAPICELKEIESTQYSLWASASTEKFAFKFFAKASALDYLPVRQSIESEIGVSIEKMIEEFDALSLSGPGAEFRIYLVEDGEREALQWKFTDPNRIVVAFAFPVVSKDELEGRNERMLDLAKKHGWNMAPQTLTLAYIHAEIVGILAGLAHEWTHVNQDLAEVVLPDVSSASKQLTINKEVRAYLVDFYMRHLLSTFVVIDHEKGKGMTFSMDLPPAVFPRKFVEDELHLPESSFNLNEYVRIQQTIAGANIAACLGKEELTNVVDDLNRLRQLVLAAVQSDHDFTKGFLLPENACRAEAVASDKAVSASSLH